MLRLIDCDGDQLDLDRVKTERGDVAMITAVRSDHEVVSVYLSHEDAKWLRRGLKKIIKGSG